MFEWIHHCAFFLNFKHKKTSKQAKHASDPKKNVAWGVNGLEGTAADMNETGIWEPLSSKSQTIKTAIESGIE